jgi:hypothetical protein
MDCSSGAQVRDEQRYPQMAAFCLYSRRAPVQNAFTQNKKINTQNTFFKIYHSHREDLSPKYNKT